MNHNAEALKKRTAAFAKSVTDLCEKASNTAAARIQIKQLLEAATSVAANYRAACRARTTPEFIAKIGLVVEQADECYGWLNQLVETNGLKKADAEAAIKESFELTAIFVASHRTAKENLERRRNSSTGPKTPQRRK